MRLRAELEDLDAQRHHLLQRVEGWSADRLAFRSALGSWSAAEVFDHIAKVETEILLAAHLGLAHPHRIGIRDRLGTRFIESIFRSDRRVKVPKSVPQVLPGPAPEMPAILAQWTDARRSLEQLAAAFPPELEHRGIFRHPIGGWMTLSGVITFFSVHRLHHGYQLDRLRIASEAL